MCRFCSFVHSVALAAEAGRFLGARGFSLAVFIGGRSNYTTAGEHRRATLSNAYASSGYWSAPSGFDCFSAVPTWKTSAYGSSSFANRTAPIGVESFGAGDEIEDCPWPRVILRRPVERAQHAASAWTTSQVIVAPGSPQSSQGKTLPPSHKDTKIFFMSGVLVVSLGASRQPERILERGTLFGEQLGPALGDVHVVFEPHPELAANIDAGLIAERHMRCQGQLVAANQVRPFVALHSHPVADTMREELVPRPITGANNHLARRPIDLLARHAGPRRPQRNALSLVNDLKDLLHLVRGLAEDKRAGDIRSIALHRAAPVNQDDRAFANRLWFGGAVRPSCKLTDQGERASREAELLMRGCDQLCELLARHAVAQGAPRRSIGLDGDLRPQAQERDFLRALDHPAARRNRRGARYGHRRRSLADAFGKDEFHRLLEAQLGGGQTALPEPASDQSVRTLVFLPREQLRASAFGRVLDLLPRAVCFKAGSNIERLAFHRQHHSEKPL